MPWWCATAPPAATTAWAQQQTLCQYLETPSTLCRVCPDLLQLEVDVLEAVGRAVHPAVVVTEGEVDADARAVLLRHARQDEGLPRQFQHHNFLI